HPLHDDDPTLSVGAAGVLFEASNSCRKMGTSRGASIPKRILPRSISTIVMQILSPMWIFSPSFRLRTSMLDALPWARQWITSCSSVRHKSRGCRGHVTILGLQTPSWPPYPRYDTHDGHLRLNPSSRN